MNASDHIAAGGPPYASFPHELSIDPYAARARRAQLALVASYLRASNGPRVPRELGARQPARDESDRGAPRTSHQPRLSVPAETSAHTASATHTHARA